MSKRSWTPAQEQCIYSHDGTLLVSAAAGSGKTSVLVQRILERITHPEHPVDVDRLLVMTFTRAAAAEMKERLAKGLSECIAERPDDLRLQRQQALLPRASIGTVDSFCSELLRENFHLLDISPRFRVAEEQQLVLLQTEAMNDTLNECYAEADPAFNELAAMLSSSRSDALLAETVLRLYHFLQPHPDPNGWLDKMASIYDDTTAIKDSVWGQCVIAYIEAAITKGIRLCESALALTDRDAKLTEKYRPAVADDLAFLRRAATVCAEGTWDELLTTLECYAATALGTVRACEDLSAKEQVKTLRGEVKSLIQSLPKYLGSTETLCRTDLHDTGRVIRALYDTVRRFTERYTEKKAAGRLLDFSDIEHLALRLLIEKDENGNPVPTALARELSERYEEVLVDEYQDTNEVQDALYCALSRDENNLFFVGDVKQSIYGFREAMPELFLKRRADYPLFDGKHYPATIVLGNNFRGRREVTEAVNFVFRQLMTEENGGLRYDDREALVCSAVYPDADGHDPEIILVDPVVEDEKWDADVAEAEVLCARIRELVGSLRVGDDQHPLRYGDCCILLRSRRPTFREVLEKNGIPVVSDTTGAFFDTAEIRLAVSVLRCIDNPLQDVPLTAWLLSPLCGFTPDDMGAIRQCRRKTALYNALTAATHSADPVLAERCRRAVEFLSRYRTLAAQLTVDRLVTRLYEDTALPELMSARTDGERRRTNLQLLQEMCERFDGQGFRGLSSFIRYVDRLQAQGMDLPGATAADTGDAVHIMTIHSSKGLEFPVVFLAGLSHEFNDRDLTKDLLMHSKLGAGIKRRNEETCNRYVTLPHQALALTISAEQRAEELRILYVAMTRAREKLCLSMVLKEPHKKLTSLAASLDDKETLSPFSVRCAKSMGEWILSALLRHPAATDWRHMIDREDLPLLSDDLSWQFSVRSPVTHEITETEEQSELVSADPAAVAQILERIAYAYPHTALARVPAKLAASDTSHHTVSRQFVAASRPAFQSAGGLTPAERGTAMHTFMQFADYTLAADNTEREISRLTNGGFLSAEQAASLDRRKLAAFFRSELYARMCRADRVWREYSFTTLRSAAQIDPAADAAEQLVVQGIADCVFEENGVLIIVDYKTDRVDTAAELVERYRNQLSIYRRAVSEALALPVGECLLYSFALGTTIPVEE